MVWAVGVGRENRSPMEPEKVVIKRVVGLEGDVIRTRKSCAERVVTVPQGQVWVEGDEAFHSVDSNNYGPVSISFLFSLGFIYLVLFC